MAARAVTGGNGQLATPYFNTTAAYPYKYAANYTYMDANGASFIPTAEQIEAGFVHMYSGYFYKTQPTVTGVKLIAANIKTIEKRIAADQKDLDGLLAAQKLLTDNPEWTTLLDLHNRGLL